MRMRRRPSGAGFHRRLENIEDPDQNNSEAEYTPINDIDRVLLDGLLIASFELSPPKKRRHRVDSGLANLRAETSLRTKDLDL